MSHFGDFMDGVPVKISEKYKRPPKIELPYSVIERPIKAQKVIEKVRFSSDFETKVLAKIKELRNVKKTKKNERRHRLQLLEEAKQMKLDAIAAADEEDRLKQLSVSEVSYPSTEEISALTPDEKTDRPYDTNLDNTHENLNESVAADISLSSSSTVNQPQLNILQPILVKSSYKGNLLDDPDPLDTLKMNMKISKVHYNHNVEQLTFQDFENDTSSPFDNMELKTINDMELLAQVLQSQRESAISSDPQPYTQDQSYYIPNYTSQAQLDIPYLCHGYSEQPMQGPSVICSPQNYPNSSGYNVYDNDNTYIQNYQYYNPHNVEQNFNNHISSTPVEASQVTNESQYIPQPYYYQHERPVAYQTQNKIYTLNEAEKPSISSQNNVKFRSRSVLDIVQELNEELEKLKLSEGSYNVSISPEKEPTEIVSQPSSSTEEKPHKKNATTSELTHTTMKWAHRNKEKCERLLSMGFSEDRIERVSSIVGDNDKKVLECLLIIGEMMDLGFSETKVLEALVKHQFDRDKVLDELVS